MIIFLFTVFIISIVLLIPAILIQSNGSDNGIFSANITAGAFGARSNEILVKFTAYCAAVFMLSALAMSVYFVKLSAPPTPSEEQIQQSDAPPVQE